MLCNCLGSVHPHAMQGFGGVIRTEIGAMTPDAAIGHQTVLEKDRLTIADVVPAEQHHALRVHYPFRNRRGIAVGEHGDGDQPGEAELHHDQDAAYSPWRKRAVVFGDSLHSDTH